MNNHESKNENMKLRRNRTIHEKSSVAQKNGTFNINYIENWKRKSKTPGRKDAQRLDRCKDSFIDALDKI